MTTDLPKPGFRSYDNLINDITRGVLKIPQFQRNFVWSLDKTAKLLDSILKGYPIGTFTLWQTRDRLKSHKTIGSFYLDQLADGADVQYILDGQQRITSLFAVYQGAEIQQENKKSPTDYRKVYVDLSSTLEDTDQKLVTPIKPSESYISLTDVLNFDYDLSEKMKKDGYSTDEIKKVSIYKKRFEQYDFSTVTIDCCPFPRAIQVFTRLNTSGKLLNPFEIMSAKTYDENQKFDLEQKWNELHRHLTENGYGSVSNIHILNLFSVIFSRTNECKLTSIYSLNKQTIIDNWNEVTHAFKRAIVYFKKNLNIPLSKFLPYEALIVSFAYFFFKHKTNPSAIQRQLLQEFFWRISLSARYKEGQKERIAQDIKRIDLILKEKRPSYKDVQVALTSADSLIGVEFSVSNSFCRAILCLLAFFEPRDFHDDAKVFLNDKPIIKSSGRNYHHFFPRKYLKDNKFKNENSIVNITIISDDLNKKISASSPSEYLKYFKEENRKIEQTLTTHLIDDINSFGFSKNDYLLFLKNRSVRFYKELESRINVE